jgi:two-component system, sensor histidine kinase
MNIRSLGIQQRAVFLALAPPLVIALALTAYFLIVRYADVEEALQNRGQALVRQLAPATEYGAFSGNRIELLRLAQATAREPDVVRVAIYDAAGQLLASAGNPDRPETSDDNTRAIQSHSLGDVELFQAPIKQPILPFEDPFQSMESTQGQDGRSLGRVVIEMSRANLTLRKREMLAVTLLVTTLILAFGILLAHRLSRDIIEPILALQDAVAKIRAGFLDVRVLPHQSGTLVSLETGFNEMATALEANHRLSASALADSEAELARQLEIAKVKKEEAERASEAKSRFLAAASHDLRQPLHALTLFAAELASKLQKPLNRQLASQIMTATGAMGELLEALLDVSRLDIVAVQPHRQALALEPILETISDSHHLTAQAKGIHVRHRPTALWVDSDPQLLRRMLSNLVANAVRYAEHGGVLIGARRRGKRVRIEVWDTGIGIDETHLPYLFQEFYQVGNPERDSSKGLGLGLAIVARLSEMLDHPVEVSSRPGRGSVFSVSVPIAEPAPLALGDSSNALAFRSGVIVRLEDMRDCGETCNLLDAWGYERHCACNDKELHDLLDLEPAAVVCDAKSLPAITAQLEGRSHKPLLVLLGENTEGVDAQLPLPLKPARLRALLHHLLDEHQV